MKKVLLMIMCAVLAVSLVACGTQNDAGGSNDGGIEENDGGAGDQTPTQPDEPLVLVTERTNSYIYEDYIYDSNGRIIETRLFNTRISETEPKSSTVYTYSEQGDGNVVVKAVSSYLENPVFSGFELFFNAEGLCVESKKYNECKNADDVFAESNFDYSACYEYDSKDNLIKTDYPDGNVYKMYGYDENGRMISYEKWENGTCITSAKLTRNEKGDIVRESITNASGEEEVTEYTCSYDHEGDILLEMDMKNSHGASIAKTTYTYGDNGQIIKAVVDARHDGLVPLEYFRGNGYLAEAICFPMTGNTVTFMPLSQALAEQGE